jgi:hypothetical protein
MKAAEARKITEHAIAIQPTVDDIVQKAYDTYVRAAIQNAAKQGSYRAFLFYGSRKEEFLSKLVDRLQTEGYKVEFSGYMGGMGLFVDWSDDESPTA